MSSSPIQFHKIWIDQCEATEGIRERFGLENALGYLIGEKLFNFVQASEQSIKPHCDHQVSILGVKRQSAVTLHRRLIFSRAKLG